MKYRRREGVEEKKKKKKSREQYKGLPNFQFDLKKVKKHEVNTFNRNRQKRKKKFLTKSSLFAYIRTMATYLFIYDTTSCEYVNITSIL